ncbi:phage/plasmid primase, P4 family [Psychrobacillus sp. FJAT-51614]|uniref:Phage/plasmid primase, P4 family n=1 Tax=Psychrobacillus mangrovi TaxID=3117745 RepID=A0ABU8F653_9BACI
MYKNIPEEMKHMKQWVCYKAMSRGEKITKVPVNPISGTPIDSNKEDNWLEFEEAVHYTGNKVVSGIGFVFTSEDDYVGIDIDGCVGENGQFNKIAEEILCQFEGRAYAEYSPSGKGIHLITKGIKESNRSKNSECGLEIYQNKRYFTVTGNMLEGFSEIHSSSDKINSICKIFLEKGEEEEKVLLIVDRKEKTDEDLLEIMFRSKNGHRLRSLYDGDWKGYYSSQSEADLALCNALAFYTKKDADQIDSLFRKSGLNTIKWDGIHYADGSTYGNVVIEKAIKDTDAVYNPSNDRSSVRTKETKNNMKGQANEFPHWYMKGSNSLTFMPGILAKHLQSKEKLIYSSEHFFQYENGVYQKIEEQQMKKKIQKHLLDEHSKSSHVRDTLEQLKNRVWYDGDLFDSPLLKNKINCKNGILNLTTRKMEEHSPELVTTIQLNANYNESASCPTFDEFINSSLSKKDVMIAQELMGYLLIPETVAEKAFILHGPGRTGKSTFLKLIEYILGKKNISNVALQDLSHQFKPSLLFGKLANIYADLPNKALQDTSLFKTLVSGDSIVAEEKFRSPFSFSNKARLLFSCNELPANYVDRTDGFYRRLIILPFLRQVEESKIDTALQFKLQNEADGIVRWALEGLERLITNNYQFTKSETTENLLFEYKKQSNNVIWYVTEFCELKVDGVEYSQNLYHHYKKTCLENNMQPISQTKFNKSLDMEYKRNVLKTEDSSKRIIFKGITIGKKL